MEKALSNLTSKIKSIWRRFSDKDYRHNFASFKVDNDLSAQIFSLREQRSLTQAELGNRAGMAQSRIAKLEGSCGGVSVSTLKRLAFAFDVALVVKFVPFSEFLQRDGEPIDRLIPSFDDDKLAESAPIKSIVVSSASAFIRSYTTATLDVKPNIFTLPPTMGLGTEMTIQ